MAIATALRKLVTGIVSQPASSAARRVVTQELVPHRFDLVTPAMVSSPQSLTELLHRMQRNTDEATQSARSLPHLGGAYFPNVSFPAVTSPATALTFPMCSAVTILHGLQAEVSWQVARVRPVAGYVQIANVTSSGGLIKITTAAATQLTSVAAIAIAGVMGVSAANGFWNITVVDSKDFTLNGSTYSGTYTAGGFVFSPGWSVYEGAQDVANGRLTLVATVPLVCDVHVFPQPQAATQ